MTLLAKTEAEQLVKHASSVARIPTAATDGTFKPPSLETRIRMLCC